MMHSKGSTRVTYGTVEWSIIARENFHTSGDNFVGISYADKPRHDIDSDNHKKADAERAQRDAEIGLVYVIWSYNTPIAWINAKGETYLVESKYSATTSRQQGIVRRALNLG